MGAYVFLRRPRGRARIHFGPCSYCRDGKGRDQLSERADITGWSPKQPAGVWSLLNFTMVPFDRLERCGLRNVIDHGGR